MGANSSKAARLGALFGLVPLLVWVLAYHPFWPRPPRALPPIPQGFTWGITWHPDSPKARLSVPAQLQLMRALNVGLSRFDVRWTDLQPTVGALDAARLPRYRALVDACNRAGLAVNVNLGTYPSWALERLKRDPEGFFRAYRRYVRAVVEALGTGVGYYQLGNEFNTVLDPIPESWDGRVFREARAEIDRYHAKHPSWRVKTVINVCDTFYLPWHAHLERVMREASAAIDVVGYDFYGGNYSHLNDWSAWPGLAYLTDVMRRYGKDGAICETGCPAFLGEGRQARWITESPRALLRAIAQSPEREHFLYAAFYELVDASELPPFYPGTEATFGLVSQDGRLKPGFTAFKEVIADTHAAQEQPASSASRRP